MRKIAIMNQKGGTAKTTTTVNLAATFAEQGKRVLVLDLDPQANTSSWFGTKDTEGTLYDAFVNNGNLENIVVKTNVLNVDVIPSSPWMVAVERALFQTEESETRLKHLLSLIPNKWDLLLIDCPPTLGFLSLSALVACQNVLVPVQTQVMPLEGLAHLLETIEHIKERLNPSLRLFAILPSLVDSRTNLSKEVIQSLRERFPDIVLQSIIRSNVRIAESYSFSKPITLYDPNGSGAQDYRAAAKELLLKLERTSHE